MKMLERAARAVAEKRGCGNSQFANCQGVCDCRVTARATIRAIREPDEEVLLAMAILLMGERTASITAARAAAVAIWRAGIDKVLEDRG